MTKYPKFLQDSENSCGAYCIKMILNYYHYDDEIKNIKKRCRMTKEGITVFGLMNALHDYHIEAKAYQCEFKKLDDELKVPAIVHFKQDNLYHYVVVYKMTEKYFLIGDPGQGLVKMTYEAFHERFTGIVIMIEHVGHPIEQRQSYSFSMFIKHHLMQYKASIFQMMLKTLSISFLTILFSLYYQMMIDYFSKRTLFEVIFISGVFFIVYIIKLVFSYYRNNNIIDLKVELNNHYITKTMQNLIYQDFSYFLQNEKGVILSRANHLFELTDYFLELYQVLFMDFFLIICILVFLLFIHWILFFICLLLIAITFYICFLFHQKIHLVHKRILENKEYLNEAILEYQDNFFHTIQFKLKKVMKNKLAYCYDAYFHQEYEKGNMMNEFQISLESFVQSMIMILLVICLCLHHFQMMTLGTVILVYMLLSYLIDPLIHVSSFVLKHDEMKIIFERYKEMIPDKKMRKKRIKKIHTIELKDITFSYGYGIPLFEHLSFSISNSFVLKGKTGCGKSTFLKLISGQLDVVKGHIYINGKDIVDIDRNSLYERMKYLGKESVFYNETLEFNLIFDDKSKYSKMIDLLCYFQVEDLISHLQDRIDRQGSQLSSGQGQLMMIIRALLCDLDLLILDEAFSHIDEKRVKLLLDYLKNSHMTFIIVSHQINLMNNTLDCAIIESGKIRSEENYGNRFSHH